jgi:protein-S-isoprenylcysteine O-methyltransferase Ste14
MVESTLRAATLEAELSGTADAPTEASTAEARPQPRYRQTGFWPRMRLKFMLVCLFALLVFSWFFYQPRWGHWAFWPGAFFTICGLGCRLWAAGWLRKHEVLATDGPYSWVRHPLYTGTGLLALGQGLMSGIPLAAIGFPLLWFILHWPAIQEEEKFLVSKYGDEYRDFQRRVPALLPSLKRSAKACPCSFSWAQAWRNREYEALLVNTFAIVFYGCLMLFR